MGAVRCVSVVLVLLVGSVRAQADDIAQAREHFRKGSKAFDLGHYREAVKEYEAAYQLKEDPALLFNIAQAYRLDGDNENALRIYKSFLNRVPDAPNRLDVERRMDEARAAIERNERLKPQPAEPAPPSPTIAPPPVSAQSAPPSAPPPPVVERSSLGHRTKVTGIGLTAGGVALLALGGAFVGLANQANGEVITSDHRYSQSAADRRDHYELADAVCFAVGGAVAVTGAVLWALSARAESRSQSKLSAFLMPNGGVGVRF